MGVELTITPGRIFKFFITIIIIAGVIGGGFYAWKAGYINQWLHKNPAPTQKTETQSQTPPPTTETKPTSSNTETPPPETSPPSTQTTETPPATGSGTIDLEIGGVEFESKTFTPRSTTTAKNGTNVTTQTGTTSTKYKVKSVTLSIVNHEATAVTLKGELIVLDSKGNNAVSSDFIYKTFDVPDINAGDTFNRKQPINTAGDVRPYLVGVKAADQVTMQITLKDSNGKIVKSVKKQATVA